MYTGGYFFRGHSVYRLYTVSRKVKPVSDDDADSEPQLCNDSMA